ncbi:uncharacterized protein LOC123304856 isoform X2 [Chrysoperla carnea]|uniref:uncharacterized protein LOC123304856 isoform X2 n=1 Tax=Chrysoperla carnea TaxID=189513 RepID=UPI001D0753D6|nr:uncharacterized protein LOC123304856 isoform X2 [Chrysoperla carnea]
MALFRVSAILLPGEYGEEYAALIQLLNKNVFHLIDENAGPLSDTTVIQYPFSRKIFCISDMATSAVWLRHGKAKAYLLKPSKTENMYLNPSGDRIMGPIKSTYKILKIASDDFALGRVSLFVFYG